MALEGFNFSCTVVLSNGTSADVQQTNVSGGVRQDMTFFLDVRPETQKSFSGTFHLAGSALTNLNDCPGDTRDEKSQRVTDAFRAWVREHDLLSDFRVEVTVGSTDGHPYGISFAPA